MPLKSAKLQLLDMKVLQTHHDLRFQSKPVCKKQRACASEMTEYFAGPFTFIAQFLVCVHISKQDHGFVSSPYTTAGKNISSQMQAVLV